MSLIANHYAHCQTENLLGAAEAADLFQSVAGQEEGSILSAGLIDNLWKAVQQRIAAHGMDHYRELIAAILKKG